MPSLANTKVYSWDAPSPGGTGTIKVAARLSNRYDGIATDLGMTSHATAADVDAHMLKPNQAVQEGYLMKMRINYRQNTKHFGADIYVPPDKVVDAIQKLPGKSWAGTGVITSCRDRLQADYR
ncbi:MULTISPECIES: hypothetical protein [Arthrospira]|uniref:Uroporphyrinogen III synthase n=1 Tax=Limnospira platensis NIES-46 TaxID=1236695 RepID=A0A5M3TFF0_LIMPL|nr:hypothetical protein [Arthrospira platensis]AMW29309.1 hypothetical protein AP285_16420 [Arthrospira platensis YZ]KDR58615.1 hypothetical protein APPUASWS_004045 [Arthrospira platensis str. Paraca]MBD2672055.1 hypothetical protein [Arthrospira platensis FACHB-439]MBD2713133.1 hypothetical protein [Arthrospira platensis FACHB-835]MDF2213201.1 hypothetical protein [Arthrospira platensis NCB002]MDT9185700.1 hypothetical protein [Limnospira sp. PMC 289.06]MDT9297947.1 hypothetical protein [Ar